jgi:hypothetical protein
VKYPEGDGPNKPEYSCTIPFITLEGISFELLEEIYLDIEDCRAKKQGWNYNNLCWRDTPRGDNVTCRCAPICDMCKERMNEWEKHIPLSQNGTHSHGNKDYRYDHDKRIRAINQPEINEHRRKIYALNQAEINEQRRKSQFKF